jgi:cytochrome c biogenesis protein CcmG, thiol:disulfide interchange protein DsbE
LSVTPDQQSDGSAATPRAQGSAAGSKGKRRRARGSDRVFKIAALVAGLSLVTFVVVIVVRGSPPSPEKTFPKSVPPSLAVGSPAPGFTLERVGGGAPVSLGSFHGTPVVLSFFASWCPRCREDLSAFAAIAHSNAGRVQVIGVDSNDGDGAAAQRLLARAGSNYPVGVDPHASVAQLYRIVALPVTYFLDARGRVVGVDFGQQTVSRLEPWIRRLTRSSG